MTDGYLFKRVTQCTSTSTLTLSSIKKKIDENHMRPKWRSGIFATLSVTYFLRKASKMFSLLFTLLLIFSFLAQSDGKAVLDIIKFRRLSLGNRWLMKIIFKEFVYHPSTMKIGWKNNEVLHFCKDVGSIKAE